ncbi:MAG: histidinol-phosphate transaminase [Christensenellales bacterium]|jgi:histidinol-phosphate aminotransferase
MTRFLSNIHAAIQPYTPGEQPQGRTFVKLNTNENPYPPSPAVIAAISAAEAGRLNLYPDPECSALNQAIALTHGVDAIQVMTGNGSDEILAFAYMAYCMGKRAVFPDITYGFYPVYARLFGVEYREIPLKADFTIDPADYDQAGGTIFIANPNAPTGIALTREQIARIARENRNDLVVVDEAYVDFGGESALDLIGELDNILVVRTFSKSRSLAGLRVGYAISTPEIIAELNAMKFSFNPYNVDRLAMLAGAAAVLDREYFENRVQSIVKTREEFSRKLKEQGYEVLPSCANFVFARHPRLGGQALYQGLKENGVLVRWFDQERIRDYLRITIGTPEQMAEYEKAASAVERAKE